MDDEPQVRPGFLPPRAPDGAPPPRFVAPEAVTPPSPPPPPPVSDRYAPAADRPVFVAHARESGPSSPLAITGTAIGSIALLLLFLSLGVGYFICGVLSLIGLSLGLSARRRIIATGSGRAGQARAAIVVGAIGLGLALLAAIVWFALDASGFSPEDLREWLDEQLERQRGRPRREDA